MRQRNIIFPNEKLLFNGSDLGLYLDGEIKMIQEKISKINKNLLNQDDEVIVQEFISQAEITPLTVHFDRVEANISEKRIPAEMHPPSFVMFRGEGSKQRPIISFHFPFDGGAKLFGMQPSRFDLNPPYAEVLSNEIVFNLIDFGYDKEKIESHKNKFINQLSFYVDSTNTDIRVYNSKVAQTIIESVHARKQALVAQNNMLVDLGIPIRQSGNQTQTISISPVKKRLPKPAASTAQQPKQLDPTLDEKLYRELLSFLNETGKEMERHPSSYRDKGEVDLRDTFLISLKTNFQSVTGETFNKKGKTDILIRENGANLFIAECKFWGGQKLLLETIDQLLSYLTWRDTKTAILLFVKNKDMQAVLNQIAIACSSHPSYSTTKGQSGESWFDFEFKLDPGNTTYFRLAVLCFHFE